MAPIDSFRVWVQALAQFGLEFVSAQSNCRWRKELPIMDDYQVIRLLHLNSVECGGHVQSWFKYCVYKIVREGS